MVTTKHCSYGRCKNDSRKPDGPTMINRYGHHVFFVKFPGKKRKMERCKKWVNACVIEEGHKKLAYETLTYDHYICSLHFVGENGPTESYPDPVPASMPAEERAELENAFRKEIVGAMVDHAAKELASFQQSGAPNCCEQQMFNEIPPKSFWSSASFDEMETAQALLNLSQTSSKS